MSTIHEGGTEGMSWRVKAGVFRGESPKFTGNRNAAVLCRGAENALILDIGYDYQPFQAVIACTLCLRLARMRAVET